MSGARPDLFRRFLEADPERLHFAAHSHHPWPDASEAAQAQYWEDSALGMDLKWEQVFGTMVPRGQEHVAKTIGLPDPSTVVFAPSTHEFYLRILSCWSDERPLRVLSSDAEFHSFERQSRRLEEERRLHVTRVPAEPFDSFRLRLEQEARTGAYDLLFTSHVHYNSGYVLPDLESLVAGTPDNTWIVLDGYHAFWALPVDISAIAHRVFYLAGGYKYAMSGEGVCWLHAPPGYGPRPRNTGWFAGFGTMEQGVGDVNYLETGQRFAGATMDPTGLYRFVGVMDMLQSEGITPGDVHAHVQTLQAQFLDAVRAGRLGSFSLEQLIPGEDAPDRGNYLTFRRDDAIDTHRRLKDANIITDVRKDRLRFGFGIYHRPEDVDALVERLAAVESAAGA